MRLVFDLEADNLLDDVTKMHVFCWQDIDNLDVNGSTDNPEVVRHLLGRATALVGHNIVRYDLVVLKKLFGITFKGQIIDTLPLSWYLEPSKVRHGLDAWGRVLGVAKPKVDDWTNLTYEEYEHRCSEDVVINHRLWLQLNKKLDRLYRNEAEKNRLIEYLCFKMQCAADQEEYGWKLDVPKAKALKEDLMQQREEKLTALIEAMPKRPITVVRNPPKVMYKQDGSLSARGVAWQGLLREKLLPASYCAPITVTTGYEDGNPNSNEQVKAWLTSLGWVPRTFKFVRGEGYGEERKIPQVRDGSELCDSVKDLIKDSPGVGLLDGLTVLNHRLGIVKGFVECERDGYLKAEIAGLTNTLRFKHMKPLVNLPSVDKPYGKEIRGLLTGPEGVTLCGSDMVSLEDNTKRQYMKPLDPEYVEEMSQEGYDPHLQLAKFAGACTQEDIDAHNAGTKSLTALRKNYKVVNYSAIYGVGAQKLARTLGVGQVEAKKLIDAYWGRNWSVRKVAESQRVRTINDEMWMLNPVSGFWHNLRYEKDRFSTLNQSTGVYCFDSWVREIKRNGVRVIGQFHDEICAETKAPDNTKAILKAAIKEVNEDLKLNIKLDVDVQFGTTYADIH